MQEEHWLKEEREKLSATHEERSRRVVELKERKEREE